MAELHCEVQKLMHTEEPTLTVGERFVLQCQGQVGVFDWKTAELRVEDADKYKIHLLRGEQKSAATGDSQIHLEVLSDQVGKHDLKNVQLVDAAQSAVIPQLQFEVRSLQDPKNPVTEPFGPVGPLGFAIPWFYWVILVGAISAVGLSLALAAYVRIRRRRLMQSILDQATGLSAEGELFQAVRRFQREWKFLLQPHEKVDAADAKSALENLDRAYRFYLSRVLLLPISAWSTRHSLRRLDRERRMLDIALRRRIGKILREFDRSRAKDLRGQDFAQFLDWVKESSADVAKLSKGSL